MPARLSTACLLLSVAAVCLSEDSPVALLERGEKLNQQQSKAARTEARDLFTRALTLARAASDRPAEARALYRLGQVNIYLDDLNAAVPALEQSAEAHRKLGDKTQQVRSLHNLAIALLGRGDAPEALSRLESVLPMRRELGDRFGEANTEMGIANCHSAMGEYAAALDAYARSLVIWRALNDTGGEAEVRNAMGYVMTLLGDHDRARIEFEAALAIWRKLDNRNRTAYASSNLGWLLIGQGRYQEAIGYLEPLPAILEETGDRGAASYALHNLGTAWAGLRNTPKALAFFRQSLEIKRAIGDRSGQAYTLQELGAIEPANARAHWTEALLLRRAISDHEGLPATLTALARLERDPAKALEAVEWIESQRSSLASQDLRGSLMARRRESYETAVSLLIAAGRTREALAIAERARGRMLLDRLADTMAGLRTGIPTALRREQYDLRTRINAATARLRQLGSAAANPADSAAASKRLTALLASERDLAARIRKSSPRYASLVEPEPLPAAGIQRLLAPGETLLQYLLAGERSYLFVVDSRQVRAFELESRDRIDRAVRALRDRISRRADWSAEAAQVHRMLLAPAGALRGRVIVAADGAVESVPFAALPGMDALEIATLPSASALALLRRTRGPAAELRLAVIADPVFSPADSRLAKPAPSASRDLARLRFSRFEADSILDLVPAAESKSAFDFDASRAVLEDPALRRYRVIHIASHAIVDSNPGASGIALASVDPSGKPRNGFFRLAEIYDLPLRADLVTLSACRSAVGSDLPGEGLQSLTRGFLYAGARSVLASLWDVDDRATALAMRKFYESYWKGAPPVSALAAAQGWVRRQPGWEHPYYWGSFTLSGEWR